MPRWHISGNSHKPKQSKKQSNRDATQHRPSRSVRISTGLSNPTKISTTSSTCSTTHNGLRDDDPATSCTVKSLGSGTFGFGMIDATKSKSTEQQTWWDSTTKTPELVASQSSLSFLTSTFGACTGVGGDFLKDSSAEGRVAQCRPNPTSTQTGLGARHCLAQKEDHKNGDDDDDNDDDDAVENLVVQLSHTALPLAKSGTCRTAGTTNATDSVWIWDESNNTAFTERASPELYTPTTPSVSKMSYGRLVSSARKLFFGNASGTERRSGETYHDNNVEQGPRQGPSAPSNCQWEDVGGSFVQSAEFSRTLNHTPASQERIPCTPLTAKRSLMASSFSIHPPKALYTPAYNDGTECEEEPIHIIATNDGLPLAKQDSNCDHVPINVTIKNEVPTAEAMGGHREIQYWRRRLQHATQHYGKRHWSTADAFFNLGLAQMKLLGSSKNDQLLVDTTAQTKHQYDLAVENLTIAHGMMERHYGPQHLAVGRALDALALAVVRRANYEKSKHRSRHSVQTAARFRSEFLRAQVWLEQAFALRVDHLGLWHVDTVETYNKLAGVKLRLGAVRSAANAYREVYWVRRAVYGQGHPSVAIAAHAVANCCYRLGDRGDALDWYEVALAVYESMGLPYRHPTVGKLLVDRSRIEDPQEV